jgi:flavin reductase (DIM6/NTAB) family NADH-FMN oxidoreductase RutF
MQVEVEYEKSVTTRYPEQVAIVLARDPEGKFNPITVGWTMLTSIQPPMMAVSIGRARHSIEALRKSQAFVVSFPSSAMAKEALLYGTKSGRDMDKLAESGAVTQPASVIDGVLLADAVSNFECRTVSEHETGDHVIFVGEVVASHVNKDPDLGRLYAFGGEKLGGIRPA